MKLILPTLALFASSILFADEAKRPGDVVLEKAALSTSDVDKTEFEFGTLYIPENRNATKSRVISIGFARFRAAADTEAPPIFLLPGGPANSIVAELKQGNPRLAGILREMKQLRTAGDVIIVDQRGFSTRGEILKYPFKTPAMPLDKPASIARFSDAFVETSKAAVADFEKKGIDLRGYTVLECADDVRDLAKALGYSKISLMGGSFGSQWSFAIMRRHPDLIARALLTGVEPLDCGYDMPSHVLAAVQRMWWEAEKDERFKRYLPQGGLMAAARQVLRRLEQKPVAVELKGVKDAKSGESVTITLGHEDFQREAFLKGPDGPAFVLAVYHERYEGWATTASLQRRSRTMEMPMIGPLIDTSLSVTPKRKYLLRTDPATEFLGHWNFDSYMAIADILPTEDVGDEFRTEKVTNIPVVFVNGDWDTQTPIENTLGIAPFFPKSHVLIVERGGHGAMNQLTQHHPKVKDSLVQFLKTADMTGLPTRISVPPPKFSAPGFSHQVDSSRTEILMLAIITTADVFAAENWASSAGQIWLLMAKLT